jgi:E3 ubiquitin-protein ligase CHFR
MLIGRLISINPEKIKNIDLLDNMQTLTIGRGSSCSIKIEDNRCSSTHCKLSLTNTGNEWKIEVEDLSTNGTFLNNQKVLPIQIGKGNKLTADWSSQLDILRAPQVDEKSKIGFKFEEIKQDKRKNEESKVEKRLVSDEKKDNDMDEKIKSTVICQICMEVMFQPVSLYPCMHNFCGGCFSDWHGRGNVECPSCRAKVNEVKKSHVIVNLVDAYFAKHPEAKRNKEELDELDAANKFKVDRVVLNKTDFKSDGSATSDSEEIAPAFRGRARARARAGSGVAAVRQQAVQNICRQCTKLVEGYKCIQGQVHLQCFGCKTYMPDRNLNQKCATCDRGYCNLYWRTGRCRVGINPVDSYKNTVFTAIRPSSISENKYEQNIINDYIRRRGLTLNIISQEMMDAMEVNKWEIDLGNF